MRLIANTIHASSGCPANSVSEREGLSQCTCVDGYYRALSGEEVLYLVIVSVTFSLHNKSKQHDID